LCAETIIPLLVLIAFLPAGDLNYMQVPGQLVDASIDGNGNVFLLLRGEPHLVVMDPEGSSREYDLPQISLPGGMCLDHGWGWYVTAQLSDRIYRYDRNGEVREEWESGELPGDISLWGLGAMYVCRWDGTVRSVGPPEAEIAQLEGSGEGQLTTMGERVVYSQPGESVILDSFHSPFALPPEGTWAGAGDGMAVLLDSCICDGDGNLIMELPVAGEFSRISFSDGGGRCLLWSPGGDRVLVVR
jgi:hypothetical protein